MFKLLKSKSIKLCIVSLLALLLVFSTITVSHANSVTVNNSNNITFLNFDGNKEQLSSKVLSDDFDLEKEVEAMPSVHEMTKEERELFDQIVEEQTTLNNLDGEDASLYKETLTDFFDESSGHANDITYAQNVLGGNNENIGLQGIKVRVGVKFAGTAINVVLGFAVGGGVGVIQAYIIKKGKKEAGRIFTKTVTSKLKAWGAKKLATLVGVSVTFALSYVDIGGQIAKQLDKRDKKPNNGWIDIY